MGSGVILVETVQREVAHLRDDGPVPVEPSEECGVFNFIVSDHGVPGKTHVCGVRAKQLKAIVGQLIASRDPSIGEISERSAQHAGDHDGALRQLPLRPSNQSRIGLLHLRQRRDDVQVTRRPSRSRADEDCQRNRNDSRDARVARHTPAIGIAHHEQRPDDQRRNRREKKTNAEPSVEESVERVEDEEHAEP